MHTTAGVHVEPIGFPFWAKEWEFPWPQAASCLLASAQIPKPPHSEEKQTFFSLYFQLEPSCGFRFVERTSECLLARATLWCNQKVPKPFCATWQPVTGISKNPLSNFSLKEMLPLDSAFLLFLIMCKSLSHSRMYTTHSHRDTSLRARKIHALLKISWIWPHQKTSLFEPHIDLLWADWKMISGLVFEC